MKRLFVVSLCMMFFVALFSDALLAADKNDLTGQQLFTRTNLKTHGERILFHNISSFYGFIPVGTAVMIGKVGKEKIKFRLVENGRKYVLLAPSANHDKYFVKDIKEIGLKDFSDEIMDSIRSMKAAQGMTKAEVYITKGCPAFIDVGKKSWGYTLDQIMESDTWYYNLDSRKIELVITFENGVVVKIEQPE